jgi:hypothetical protein
MDQAEYEQAKARRWLHFSAWIAPEMKGEE